MGEKIRPKIACLRWAIKLRRRGYNCWALFALLLCIPAFFVPRYRVAHCLHTPVGVYIALLGGLAVAVTLRKEPWLKEKAAWVGLISLLMYAEIRNLYVADREQTQTFLTIQTGLNETKTGLDASAKALSGISEGIGKASGESQKQFDMAAERSNVILDKTQVAADRASEAVSTLTGGDSVPEIMAVRNIAEGNPPRFPLMLDVYGKHALRNVAVFYQDVNHTKEAFKGPVSLEQIKSMWQRIPLGDETDMVLPGARLLDTSLSPGEYVFNITTASGSFYEEMTTTLAPNSLNEIFKVSKDGRVVIQLGEKGYIVKPPK
jgi:hypothetical protein